MASKIFQNYQGSTIRIDGVCYTFLQETVSSINADPNEIQETFDSCLECENASSSSSSSIDSSSSDSSSSSSEEYSESSSSSQSLEWYNEGWQYRQSFTVHSSLVNSNLTDMPVYINLHDLYDPFFDNVKSDGGDIRITKSNSVTEVAIDLVSIDTTNKLGEIWFNSEFLSSSVDTTFYIYYGNSGASGYAITDTYGAENVYSSDFKLVMHLNEAGNSTHLDSTNNDNDGTPVNMVSGDRIFGYLGNGLNFDRSSSKYVEVADHSSIRANASGLSAAFWVFKDSDNNYQGMIDKFNTTGTHDWFVNAELSGTIYCGIYGTGADGDSIGRITNSPISLNQWHHIVMTWGGANSATDIHMYVNGVNADGSALTNGTFLGPQQGTATLRLGHDHDDNSYLDGKMDEVWILRKELSSSEIAFMFNNQKYHGQSLIGHWDFEEGSGSTAFDTSGHDFDLTLVNSPTWDAGIAPVSTYSLEWDGAAYSYITSTLLIQNTLRTSPWTLSMFISPTVSSTSGIYCMDNGTSTFVIYTTGSGSDYSIDLFYRDSVGVTVSATSGLIYTLGETHHVVCFRSGTTIYLYVDGSFVDSGSNGALATLDLTSENFYIGNTINGANTIVNEFTGNLDDGRLYNRILTTEEISNLSSNNKTEYVYSLGQEEVL